MYKYTIIIPHKNIPKLLKRCLDTIPRRKDIQVIIIDDNSDPTLTDFKTFPGINENNIDVFFTKENKGAGYARNIGLKHAKGKWIIFADADDIFLEDFEYLLSIVENIKADIIYFNTKSKDSETLIDNNETLIYNEHISNAYNKDINNIKYKIIPPWGKIYDKDFLDKNNLLFEEIKHSNDVRFSIYADFYAKKLSIIPITAYCWMTRHDSLYHKRSIDWAINRFHVSIGIYQFMKQHQIEELIKYYYNDTYYYLNQIKQYSLNKYLKCLFIFGYKTNSMKTIFFQCPILLIHIIKKKIGIKKSITSIFYVNK